MTRSELVILMMTMMIGWCTGAKILCVYPMPGRSHTIITEAICKELATRNHQITAITAFPSSKKIPNYREISTADLADFFERKGGMDIFESRHLPTFLSIPFIFDVGLKLCDAFLSHPNVKELLDSSEQFDLIYTEMFLDESIFAGLSQKYNAPVVIINAFMASLWSNNLVGNPAPYAYIPDVFLGLDNKLTFVQRVHNVLFSLGHELMYRLHYLPQQDAIMRKHFGDHLPPVSDLIKNVSLVFVNHHFSLAYPRPYVPNMIEIGGFHVRQPKKLPQDIQEYLDNAKNGVIFFSFGSNLQAVKMPKDRLQVFLDVFSRLKLNILWKWENDTLPVKLDNVKTSPWFPQSDILAHPNIKLFITHGGLLSTTEAVIRGVPLVGIPIFAEQPLNMRIAEMSGYAKKINFDEMTADELEAAILDVINNPSYRENIKKRSSVLNDTPLPAMERAVYWIEYVLRHKGAYHLRSTAQDLPWYSLYLIDVLAVLAGVAVISSIINIWILKKCLSLCRGRGKKITKTTSHKKKN